MSFVEYRVMRPNVGPVHGWLGHKGESEREDVLYICTLQVPGKRVVARKGGGHRESFWVHRIQGREELRS